MNIYKNGPFNFTGRVRKVLSLSCRWPGGLSGETFLGDLGPSKIIEGNSSDSLLWYRINSSQTSQAGVM